ncbi:MAG: hypothetical protein K0Q72_3187 [Armatimonadetes bacterium]|nr:hypothetical protein [Armatimonadota bacterium]
MLRILRQLSAEEARQVAAHAGARPGAAPEELIRTLSRACGANVWGLFPAQTDDVLLDYAGRRLGMLPMTGGLRAVPSRERAILAYYVRQAWESADDDRRRLVLRLALDAWDSATLPRPEVPANPIGETLHIALEAFLQHSAGCRALASATENAALTLPLPSPPLGRIGIPYTVGAAGHLALYGVLLVLWRARARLLRDKRMQRFELERQLRQVESLLTVRQRNLAAATTSWTVDPRSGLSLTAAAAVSVGVHTALASAAAVSIIPALAVGTAGVIWSVCAATAGGQANTDPRVTQMHAQIQAFRVQIGQLDRDLFELEIE